jgi:glycosyltransferase involved in cell wall biosynthesis
MLRVLQVIPTLDRAGAEKQMVLLATGLPRDRFNVEVAALTRLGPLKADLDAAGIPVTLFGKRLKLDAVTLTRLGRFMQKGRFDVVNTWIFAANTYGRIAARMAKVPVVIASEMAVDLWKGRSQLRVDRWLANWTDRIVGNSRAVVDFYHTVAKIPPERLSHIYSGIADDEPPPIDPADTRRDLNIEPDAPLILYAGRLALQKNVADLIDALDLLQHVEPLAVTLIAGDGPLRDQLIDRARSFTLIDSGRLRFLGHRDDVPRLLAAADILVLPSSYEGLPNIVLEAMRFRKPVVAATAPGTTELVVDKETGLLVPIGNPTELTRALRTLIRDPAPRIHLGAAGRQRVEEHFTARAMIDHYADLYEQLVHAKKSALHSR